MSLDRGRHYLAIPGPSVMPDRVLAAMQRPAPNIYEGDLIDMTATIVSDLKWVAGTDRHLAIYVANGHGVWEAALANIAAPGETVLILQSGRFGEGWADVAAGMGITVQALECGPSAAPDPARVEAALRADTEGRIKAVLLCHVDTSTGILTDVPAIRAAMDAAGHPALLGIDCIASLACDRMEMDAWGVDLVLAASQKGLMTPPGLGFVWFSDKAQAVSAGVEVSRHRDWGSRAAPDWYYQHFHGTAPTHHLFALRAALDMLKEEGLEAIWARHDRLARAYWAAIETWGQGGAMRLNVADAGHRSRAITSVQLPDGQAEALRRWCSQELGVTLGIGLGRDPGEDYFRIGHMGHLSAHMVLGVVGVLEAGMLALGIAHRAGGPTEAARVLAQGGVVRTGASA